MKPNTIKPFAITATTLGHPRKLHTPITILNISEGKDVIAARVNAMWDTGAEICLISKTLAELLRIKFNEPLPGSGVFGNGRTVVGIAYVSLIGNGTLVDTYAAIVDSTSPSGEYSFIIGMDFIRKGTLAISSSMIDTTLSFTIPSPEPIDFTKLNEFAEGAKAYLPLSSERENICPVCGGKALELLIQKND